MLRTYEDDGDVADNTLGDMNAVPRHMNGTKLSVHRFGRSAESFLCLLFLSVCLAAVLHVRPSVGQSVAGFLAMFIYIGLAIGVGMAALATVGYAIGGAIAMLVERDAKLAANLLRAREYMVVLAICPFAALPILFVLKGLLHLEVPFLEGYTVSWSDEPIWFVAAMCFWGATGAFLYVCLSRRLAGRDVT